MISYPTNNEVERVKKTIVIALVALCLLLVNELTLTQYDDAETSLLTSIVVLILFYFWANSDTVQVIHGLILWGTSTLVFYLSWSYDGIYNSALFAYPCIILLAYTMGSRLLVIPLFIAITLEILILAYAHEAKLITVFRDNSNLFFIRAIDLLIVLSLFGSISYVFIRNFKLALKKRSKNIDRLKRQLHKANKLLDYDELTELARTSVFEREVSQTLSLMGSSFRLGFFILDISNLRQINNTLGRQLGDLVLRELGKRLRYMLKEKESAYRLSGQRFALAKLCDSPKEIDLFRERILQAMSTKFDVDGLEIFLTFSLGATVAPFDGQTVDQLQNNACLALQYADNNTFNNVSYFQSYMKTKEEDQYFYIHALKNAIENQQLVLYYQPKIELQTGQIIGLEALVRWLHPERGLIPPNEFIAVAEESGQIVDITKWAINCACADIENWRITGLGDISVAINISIVDFRNGSLPQVVFKALNFHRVSPHLLELEITESIIFDDVNHVREQINKMNERGVSFAIDDFGTGYSNLGYLSQFNVATLKIDQSFIRNICENSHNQHIVKAIINMSQSLGIENVAEGVEDEETANWLSNSGCGIAQGYYWSKPIPANEVSHLLQAKLLREKS